MEQDGRLGVNAHNINDIFSDGCHSMVVQSTLFKAPQIENLAPISASCDINIEYLIVVSVSVEPGG